MAHAGMPLAGPKAYALIVGASSFTPESGLSGYRSIRESALLIAAALKDGCGMAEDRVGVLLDPDAGEIIRVLEETAADARGGVFLFYYIGHGLLQTTARETSFSLAAADTVSTGPDRFLADGVVPFQDVSDILSATGQPSIAVLDCCFSANAAQHLVTIADRGFVSSTPFGTYLLAAAGLNEQTFGPDPRDPAAPAEPTLFTGALVKLLTAGDLRSPALLTLEDCYRHVKRIADGSAGSRPFPSPWAYRSGDIGRLILAPNRAVSSPVPAAAEEPDPTVECPYMGLAPYQSTDAHLYAGRADALDNLVRELVASADAGLPLIVTGPSGVGKSSLIGAGLVPLLEQDAVPGWPTTHAWPVLRLTPGHEPLQRLAEVLADSCGARRHEVLAALRSDPGSITALLERIGRRRSERVTLVIDQFEELFTRPAGTRRGRLDRSGFARALAAAARPRTDGPPRAVVVVVVRGDHFTSCTDFPELLDTVLRNDVLIPPMTDRELRQAVVEPARKYGLTVAPELVERLLQDLRAGAPAGRADDGDGGAATGYQGHDASGILPLLSHSLLQTYARRAGRTLTLGGYQASGGLWGSIANVADRVYRELADLDRGQEVARLLLLSMVQLGQNSDDSRRQIDLGDPGLGNVPKRLLDEVVERFAAERLITLDRDADGRPTATLTHEAVLRSWPRLRDWIDDDRAALYLRQQLVDASHTWHKANRDAGHLYRGSRLTAAREWAADPRRWQGLPDPARQFVVESIRQERLEVRRARRAKLAVRGAVAVVLTALVGYLIFQHDQTDAARHQALVAVSKQAADAAEALRGSDVPDSMLVALSAYRLNANDQTLSSLLDTSSQDATAQLLQPLGQFINAMAMSSTAPVMAIGAVDQKADSPAVTLWDVSDPARPKQLPISLTGPYRGINSLAFSPDGRTLFAATTAGNGGVWSWQLGNETGHAYAGIRLAGTGSSGYQDLAVSGDGDVLAATDLTDNAVHLWSPAGDAGTAAQFSRTPTGIPDQGIGPLDFVPGTHDLLAGQNGAVWELRPTTLHAPIPARRLLPPSEHVAAVAFNASGTTLATGSRDGTLRLWSMASPTPTLIGDPVAADEGTVYAIAFSSDGRSIATGSSDQAAKVWDVATHELIQTLHMDSVIYTVAFTRQNDALAVLDGATSVQLWQFPGSVIAGPVGEVYSVATDQDGRLVAAASQDGYVRIWSVADSHHYKPLGEPLAMNENGDFPTAVAMSQDGTLLAAGDLNGDVDVWNIADPAHPVRLSSPAQIPQPTVASLDSQSIDSLAFLPRQKALAVGTGQGKVYFVDLGKPGRMKLLNYWIGPDNATTVYQVAVDSTGTIMVNATDQGDFVEDISDLADAQSIGKLLIPGGDADPFDKLAFSHHGEYLVTSGELTKDKNAGAIYDLSDPRNPRFLSYFSGPSESVWSVAFSPDDQALAAGSADDDVWLWNVGNPSAPVPLATLVGHTQQVTSLTYATNDLLISGSVDSTVRLWDTQPATATNMICSYYPLAVYSIQDEWARWFSGTAFNPPCP
jgi:WD40 repeat protein